MAILGLLGQLQAMSLKYKLLLWLSCVTDFIGIFFVILFSFYNPTGNESYFIVIQNINNPHTKDLETVNEDNINKKNRIVSA